MAARAALTARVLRIIVSSPAVSHRGLTVGILLIEPRDEAALALDGERVGLDEYVVPHGIRTGAIRVDRINGINPES